MWRWWFYGVVVAHAQVDDLFSYFKFLRYSPYDSQASFKVLWAFLGDTAKP